MFTFTSIFISMVYFNICFKSKNWILNSRFFNYYINIFSGPLIIKEFLSPLDLLNDFSANCETEELMPKILKGFLEYSASSVGPKYVRKTWKKNNMKWTDYMPEKDVATYIQKNVKPETKN